MTKTPLSPESDIEELDLHYRIWRAIRLGFKNFGLYEKFKIPVKDGASPVDLPDIKISHIIQLTYQDLVKIKGMGPSSIQRLIDVMKEAGFGDWANTIQRKMIECIEKSRIVKEENKRKRGTPTTGPVVLFNNLAYPGDNNNVTITLSRYSVDTLFNRLLIPENKGVEIIRSLIERHDPKFLEQLWSLCSDRFKVDALNDKGFRLMMNCHGISFKEDAKRLNLPFKFLPE